jgi:ribosomal protein S18 acetylase RimI-like enzyme
MEYLIRPCKEKDLDALIILCSQHAQYERADYISNGKSDLLKDALFKPEPDLYVLVVSVADKIIGYASYTFDFSTWNARRFLYMDCLYIEPDFRNHGIGEALMRRLKEIAQVNDCVNMQWQTPVWNERAIKFYQRFGGIPKEKIRFSLPI